MSQAHPFLCLITLLLLGPACWAADKKGNEPSEEERARLLAQYRKLSQEGAKQYREGAYAESAKALREALDVMRRIYPQTMFPDGRIEIALALSNLGEALSAGGAYEKSHAYLQEALAMHRRLATPKTQADLAGCLTNLGLLLGRMGAFERAETCHKEALAIHEKSGRDHRDFAATLNNLALVLEKCGRFEQALAYHERAIAMNKRLYGGRDHPHLAMSFNNIGSLLIMMGQREKALPMLEQGLVMMRRLCKGKDHPNLATMISNLGNYLEQMEAFDKAETAQLEALAMRRRLFPKSEYPDGHPDIAESLGGLSLVYQEKGQYADAVRHAEEGVSMLRKLYPKAEYPDGQPELATDLNNLGHLWKIQGEYEKALKYIEEAVAMERRLYGEAGHLNLAFDLSNLAWVLWITGRTPEALRHFEESLHMFRHLTDRVIGTSSEPDALAFLDTIPYTQDGYLSATRGDAARNVSAYRFVWDSKGALTRVLERRHLAMHIALVGSRDGSPLREQWHELSALRRRIAQLQLDNEAEPRERSELLSTLTDRRDRLETQIAKALPDFDRIRRRDAATPTGLTRALPPRGALIDFLQYSRFEYDLKIKGDKGEKRTPHYVAFVLAPGKEPARIELGPAAPIDEDISAWRRALAGPTRDEAIPAERLRRTVWEPVAKHLPPDCDTVYLATDSSLALLPFAALPTKTGGILLEEFALAHVPHGPFLLDHLQNPPRQSGSETTLALGGVRYNGPGAVDTNARWRFLDGTTSELQQVQTLAEKSGPVVALTGSNADSIRLAAALPTARYAHLATHGFFAVKELVAEQNRFHQFRTKLAGYQFQHEVLTRRMGAGRGSPLGYVGLVLAGANAPLAASRPLGMAVGTPAVAQWPSPIFTGDRIIELPLENLRLCVLSACETGLGDLTGGEGVQGLQRAFHLAGCQNVVCSLWSVNDEATAALMRRFYFHLWEKKQEPLQALRLAQLELYRNPTQVNDLRWTPIVGQQNPESK